MTKYQVNPRQITAEQARLSTYQTINGARHQWDTTQNYMIVNGARIPIGKQALLGSDTTFSSIAVTPAPSPPQFQFTFDTIGQVIVRSMGDCRLAVHPIWALGVSESGDVSISNTQTFAGAVCAPIDPLEEGGIGRIWDGGSLVFESGSAVAPPGWTPEDATLLAASLAGVVSFPGNEAQLPASLIVADKGPDRTSAFRGIRYFIFPGYPINGGGRGGGDGLPKLSVEWKRSNDDETPPPDAGAFEFLAGSS